MQHTVINLGFPSDTIINLAILGVLTAIAVVLLCMMRGEPRAVTRWRPAAAVLVLGLGWLFVVPLVTSALRIPVVFMDTDGLWCAPWSEPVAWESIEGLERIPSWLKGGVGTGRHVDAEDVAIKFRLREPPGSPKGPRPWEGVEPAWIRPVLWLSRRSGSVLLDRAISFDDRAAAYCHIAGFGPDGGGLRGSARWFMALSEKLTDPAYPGYRELLPVCIDEQGSYHDYCANYVWDWDKTCRQSTTETYDECMDGYASK